jgi:hypothetical protein
MTSRRLTSAALSPVYRTNPVVALTLLLCGTAIWQFFQVLLLMPFTLLPITLLGFLLCGLQILAGMWVWGLLRKGAILAVAISSVRFAVLGLQSYLFSSGGVDWLTLAGMVLSLGIGLVVLALLVLSWHRMR